jgi:hypothetical protein
MVRRYGVLLALLVIGSTIAIATAIAHNAGSSNDGAIDNAKITHNHHHQHGPDEGHLPATSANVQLVSQLELKNVVEDKIADVGVFEGYAYLAAWGGAMCKYNGVHVVDIRNPAAPKEVAFIQAKEGSAPGEGIQTIHIDTASYDGDILVSNNEKCKATAGFGGLNIYDVDDPAHPTVLAEGFGDETVAGQGKKAANEIHSIFAWDAGSKAYAVIVDNEEEPDVDIVDISNPKKPAVVAEYDLDQKFPQIVQATPTNLVEIFHHDVVVKEIGGRQIMLVSYWDGGYVTLDVTDPTNATYVADSDFANPDPELLEQAGLSEAPEGNAHEAEFTKDSNYIIAADEDFNPLGVRGTTNDGGTFRAGSGSGTKQIPLGAPLTGLTRYVGRACIGDPAPPAPAGAPIAVVSRGLCTFTEKIASIEAAGYTAAIVVNREGADGCGAFGMSVEGGIPALSVPRSDGFALFDKSGFDLAACLAGTAELLPGVALGDTGDTVTLSSFFDGWGYVHLYRNAPGKLQELDRFAIPEAMNPAFAQGFGDLSVHEVAVSPTRNDLAYFSYYSGGFRVLKIVNDKFVEVGRFIHEDGNNFWGVQVFHHNGQEYVAASDMDHGLFIFRYTGSA